MVIKRNKKGWIRMLETTIAILIVSSVLILTYSKQQANNSGIEDYVSNIHNQILKDISTNESMRKIVLGSDDQSEELNDFAATKVPEQFEFYLEICNLTIPPTPCKLPEDIYIQTREKEVFAKEAIISASVDEYNPKKVKLFLWVKE